jgi:DNA/RNA-binding domain of Phe-tRNA-synthetase-like protein
MEPPRIALEPHPLLRVACFATTFAAPLAATPEPLRPAALLRPEAAAPFRPDEALRAAIRDMLRAGSYKPTGRGKPASEYLVRAAAAGALGSINPAVDACNAVSLHSGFPISLIDLDRARPPFTIRTAAPGESYVFNAAGQEIQLAGLVCLCDAGGPCGNAVKDAQRTKTHDGTVRTLSVLWGCAGWEERLEAASSWYRELVHETGATTAPVETIPAR